MAASARPGYHGADLPFSMTTPSSCLASLVWCPFEDISSGADAASAAAACSFSFSTLQVASRADAPGFAITEHEAPETWRWALIGEGGRVVEEGCSPTREAAKTAATDALNLVKAVFA
jgi:hypothetical protein